MKERQVSFAGGEFDPKLWGRTDLQQYATGAKTVRNFIVEPGGVLSNRPGTQHVGWIYSIGSDGEPDTGEPVLLMPFVFAVDDAVMMAFYDRFLRFFKKPAATAQDHTGSVNYIDWHVASGERSGYVVFPSNQLPKIRAAQIGNLLTLAHPDLQPQELKRLTADSTQWQRTQLTFSVPAFPEGSPMCGNYPYVRTDHTDFDFDDLPTDEEELARITVEDATHETEAWQWQVTRIVLREDGSAYESAPFTVDTQYHLKFREWRSGEYYYNGYAGGDPVPQKSRCVIIDGVTDKFYLSKVAHTASEQNKPESGGNDTWDEFALDAWPYPYGAGNYGNLPELVIVSATRPVRIQWPNYTQICTTADDVLEEGARIIATRVYRGQDGRFGLLGETTDDYYVDKGETPDLASPPPAGTNPFEVYDADGVLLRTEDPKTVAYFQNRRYFGGTEERPQQLFASAVGDYNNFDEVSPAQDDDSLQFEFASKRLEAIHALVPKRQLQVLTASSIWSVTGSEGELVTPNSIAAYPAAPHGCAELDPIEVQGAIVFLQLKGGIPWAAMYSNEGGGYRAFNLARLSRHLFDGHTIISWAYAEDPFSILWAVRDDGVLLSLTLSFDEQMTAWARHDMGGDGLVKGVATIPEGSEDAVYLVVRRGTKYNVERMASRVFTDVRDGVFLDASITKGLSSQLETVQVTSGDLEANEQVDVKAYNSAGTNVDGATLWGVDDIIHVEDPDGGAAGRFRVMATGLTNTCVVYEELPADIATTKLGFTKCFQSVENLHHLEGESVMALVDGSVAGPFTVEGGSVSLGIDAAIATVGLAVTAEFEGLDMVGDKTKRKSTRSVMIETEGSRGGYVGSTLDGKLEEVRDRETADDYGPVPLKRHEIEHVVASEWGAKGSVAVRHTDPLPLTILGITRDVEIGG